MSCNTFSTFAAFGFVAMLVMGGIVAVIIIMIVKATRSGAPNGGTSNGGGEGLPVYPSQAAPTQAPVQQAAQGDGAHKCPSCGATFKGAVCPYCDTPFRD